MGFAGGGVGVGKDVLSANAEVPGMIVAELPRVASRICVVDQRHVAPETPGTRGWSARVEVRSGLGWGYGSR